MYVATCNVEGDEAAGVLAESLCLWLEYYPPKQLQVFLFTQSQLRRGNSLSHYDRWAGTACSVRQM